ncbi:Bug family tripartite tricarboxylate transporter substrate binding protein [Sinorhizobium meliloti]|uniref:Bug family tripartite tricarboxylate transporter substrate binding protein n=1 Tax=Rhizobium meliloti TaxID=382 RepID=UPI000FD1A9F6|nr:tripartite tricarboxylate transporter substrate-binding protein [Sinorhizobium meliloti]MQV20496.1 tripartite tricarboxylate transporter substrate binding protein [Sinorhizobium meliloti]MQV33058.1 tripartite tricarboxylate transporter substrate binding protein [Sinorhizobium meliloti]RVE85674.1 tripartite tricarboxylate transporter substrate binding protein [Sinorhizobium meliloti]RVG49209.1 tripartite tricarboxylate transporter substrate binding protein [Sinorhizobium meliloti]RVM03719.1 
MIKRRGFLAGTAGVAIAGMLGVRASYAANFGSMDIFIPGAPGGGWDLTGRVIDEVLKKNKLIGNSRITNAGGAGGTIGLPQFINQYDGEASALFIAGAIMVGTIITNNTPVNLTMLKPVARLTGEYQVLVVPSASPVQNLTDFVDLLKRDPKAVTWAGGAPGGADHIFACMIAKAAGVGLGDISYVAYTGGGGEAMASLLGNQVSCGISGYGEFAEQIKAGNLRAIALSAPERVAGIEVPTLVEQGVDVTISNWRGVFGAPNISDDEVSALIALTTAMVKTRDWQDQLASRGWTDQFLPGAEFAAYLEKDTAATRSVLVDLGLAK